MTCQQLSNEVVGPEGKECGQIDGLGDDTKSTGLHKFLPAAVTRAGMAWLMSYIASPSL